MRRRGLLGSVLAAPVAFVFPRIGPRKIGGDFPAVFGYEVRGAFAADQVSFGSMAGVQAVGRFVEDQGQSFTGMSGEMAYWSGGALPLGIKSQSARELRPHAPRDGELLDDLEWSWHGDTIGSADVSEIVSDVGEL